MNDRLDPTPRDADEAARLERARASLAKAGPLPEGVSIDFGFADHDTTLDQIAATDAAVFTAAHTFTYSQITGTPLPVLPCAHIDGLDYLVDALLNDELECRHFGMVNEIGGRPVPLLVTFRLVARGRDCPLYVSLAAAPEQWQADAMHRMVIAWPPLDDGRLPYIATGPMRRFDKPMVVPPKMRRNDPCPCGSGKKAKRCCFR